MFAKQLLQAKARKFSKLFCGLLQFDTSLSISSSSITLRKLCRAFSPKP